MCRLRSAGSTSFSDHAVHDDLDHHFLFVRSGFGDHDRQGSERLVCDRLLRAGFIAEQRAVPVQKIEEHRSGNALVSVGEGVVLCDEVQQICGLFLKRRVDLHAAELLKEPNMTVRRMWEREYYREIKEKYASGGVAGALLAKVWEWTKEME